MNFLDLVKNAKKDASSFPTFRLAILADSSTQFFVQALKGMAFQHQLRLEIFDPGLDQRFQELSTPSSLLSLFQPSLLFLYSSSQVLVERFGAIETSLRDRFAETLLEETQQTVSMARSNGLNSFCFNTIPFITDSVFGQLGAHLPQAYQYQIRKYNYLVTEWASKETGISILDLEAISGEIGVASFFDSKLYYSSQAEISFAALPSVAVKLIQSILPQLGKTKKCIVLDLDDTLWGGIVGDDGLENLELGALGKGKVYAHFQKWLKELKNRGILLCICSKNEEAVALEVFEKHPDMILTREDIVSFKANWSPKSENLQAILQQLNISADSVVFLDDNPAERDLIRTAFPETTVPELPRDPALWLSFLTHLNLFETASYSETDKERTLLYQQETQRKESLKTQDLTSYLKGLEMKATLHELNAFTLPRVAQLTQRTNQFNLRTQRYTEEQISTLLKEGDKGWAFSLSDKFGDYGIVSAVLLKPEKDSWFIDTWIMSCRVFGRGLEHLVFELLLKELKTDGKKLKAEYVPTAKNKPVENLLPDLGFQLTNGGWELNPLEARAIPHFIQFP